MSKILFIGPINTNGRFEGGITSYCKTIIESQALKDNGVFLYPLNNTIVKRKTNTRGKLDLRNVLNFLKSRKEIAKALKKDNFDSIYLNSSFGISLLKDLLTLKRKYKKNHKVYLHIHFAELDTILTTKSPIRKMILKNIQKKVTNIISLSYRLKDELIELGFDENNISVLYNYFDPNLIRSTKDEIINKYKSDSVFNFLFIGSIDKRKGFLDLFDVFKNMPTSNLILCGKPNDDETISAFNEICKYKNIIYKGFISGEEKTKAFKKANVLILPSYGEGLPITILEAMNFGLPILSTNVGAIPEIINEDAGILFNPGDKAAMKSAINLLSTNKEKTLNMSLNSLNEANKYTFDIFVKNLINIIK